MIKAIAFDLGDTLVEYEGLHLSWVEHYPEALRNLAAFLGLSVNAAQIDRGSLVLRRYNTRLNPRENEFSFAEILPELLPCLGLATTSENEYNCATAFFRLFRQRLRCFPETKTTLQKLCQEGVTIGIFTDVPYGMPRELVLEDLGLASLEIFSDALLTSREVGYRKPSIRTLQALAARLGCEAREMSYVGNERKDVEVAQAFGCHSILIDRAGHGADWGQDRTIASLSEL
ncbi:MAG: HAD family hydrolase [Lacunisphaera sp.]